VTIVTVRDNDDPIECLPLPGTDGICPEVAPDNYQWSGTVELTATGNSNSWSTTIRRNGTDGGEVVWTGLLEDGDTHDFGPVGQPAGIAPGGTFTFSVVCNEMLGSGSCSDADTASVPSCDNCGAPECETEPGSGIEKTCPEGSSLGTDCECYDFTCPDGTIFNPTTGVCDEECENGMELIGGECQCPPDTEWNGAACQPCDSLGTLVSEECSGTTQICRFADGSCGQTETITPNSDACGGSGTAGC
jgi:hypothetical protein